MLIDRIHTRFDHYWDPYRAWAILLRSTIDWKERTTWKSSGYSTLVQVDAEHATCPSEVRYLTITAKEVKKPFDARVEAESNFARLDGTAAEDSCLIWPWFATRFFQRSTSGAPRCESVSDWLGRRTVKFAQILLGFRKLEDAAVTTTSKRDHSKVSAFPTMCSRQSTAYNDLRRAFSE